MSDASKESRRQKAKLAAAKRHHPDQDHSEKKRDLVAANIEAYIERHIAEVPRFTDEQLARIALILRPPLARSSKVRSRTSTSPVTADRSADGSDAV